MERRSTTLVDLGRQPTAEGYVCRAFSIELRIYSSSLRSHWQTIATIAPAGVLPRRNTASFIEWDERRYNAVADHAANAALDTESDWERGCEEDARRATTDRMNLRMCVDGALRGNGKAAGGMVIYGYTSPSCRRVLYRAGKCFGHLNSAFLAEMLALEWALGVLLAMFVGGAL